MIKYFYNDIITHKHCLILFIKKFRFSAVQNTLKCRDKLIVKPFAQVFVKAISDEIFYRTGLLTIVHKIYRIKVGNA